jgi:hypothetical protein
VSVLRPCRICQRLLPASGFGAHLRMHEDARRPSSSARGYGSTHQTRRSAVARDVAEGTLCARCGQPILPGQAWDLGHTDDRTGYSGPEHATCNRGAPRKLGRNAFFSRFQTVTQVSARDIRPLIIHLRGAPA